MDCKSCKETKGISQYEKDIQSAEHRHAMSILWRIILGQTIIICLLIGGIFYTVNSYDFELTGNTQVSVDGKDGVANYVGNDGSIANNGEDNRSENDNLSDAEKGQSIEGDNQG